MNGQLINWLTCWLIYAIYYVLADPGASHLSSDSDREAKQNQWRRKANWRKEQTAFCR